MMDTVDANPQSGSSHTGSPHAGAPVTDATLSSRSVARVETENASRFLKQLCKHFAHKLPTGFDDADGRIDFPIGVVRLAADATGLDLSLESSSEEQRAELEDVVARHLLRFAFREDMAIDWRRISPGDRVAT